MYILAFIDNSFVNIKSKGLLLFGKLIAGIVQYFVETKNYDPIITTNHC